MIFIFFEILMKLIMPINQCPNNRAPQSYFHISRIPNDKRRKKFYIHTSQQKNANYITILMRKL